MPRTFSYSLCLAAAMVLCFSPASAQDSARRTGLNGNILIKDFGDLQFFPHEAITYKRKARLHTDGGDNWSGVALSGDKSSAWGIGFRNTAIEVPTGSPVPVPGGGAMAPGGMGGGGMGPGGMAPGGMGPGGMEPPDGGEMLPEAPPMEQAGPNDPPAIGQVLDAFYARDNWGLRLGVGLGAMSAEIGEAKPEASSMELNLNFGMDLGAMDLGVIVGLSGGEVKDVTKEGGLTVGTFLRGYKEQSAGVELGYYAGVAFASATNEPQAEGAEKTEATGLWFQAGAGPVIKKGGSTISIYGELGMLNGSTKTGDVEASGTVIFVPAAQAAFETPLNDWTAFRAGMGYQFNLVSGEAGDNKVSGQAGDTSYAVGLSATWKDVVFDLDLNKSFLVNGPHMISGQSGALASNISATYSF